MGAIRNLRSGVPYFAHTRRSTWCVREGVFDPTQESASPFRHGILTLSRCCVHAVDASSDAGGGRVALFGCGA